MVRWGRVFGYYGVALAGISVVGVVLAALGTNTGSAIGVVGGAIAMWAPTLGAAIVQWRTGERPLTGIGLRPVFSRWLMIAALLGLAVPVVATGAQLLVPGVTWDPEMNGLFERFGAQLPPAEVARLRDQIGLLPVHPWFLGLVQALVAGATVNALFTIGEELGWRGFLERELRPLGFWRASWLTGALWGLWHTPLILGGHNYPEHRVIGVFLFTAFCMALSPWLTLVRQRSGTVWAAALLHGVLNGGGGLPMMVAAGSDLAIGAQGIGGVAALVLSNGLLLALVGRAPEPR